MLLLSLCKLTGQGRLLLAAYRVDNRDGAVGHGIQLVQATGLKAGGHEQQVTACRDAVGHAHTEAHPPPALVLPVLLHLPAPIQGINSHIVVCLSEGDKQTTPSATAI